MMLGCAGLVNDLTESDLPSLIQKFNLDTTIYDVKLFPNTWACDAPDGYFAVYEAYHSCGLRFPIYPAVMDVLRHYQLALSQFTPAGIRYIIGFILWCRLAQKAWSLQLFRTFYMIKHSTGHYYYVCKRPNKKFDIPDLIVPTTETFSGWKHRYFFVKPLPAPRIGKWSTRDLSDPGSNPISHPDIKAILRSKIIVPLKLFEDDVLLAAHLASAGPAPFVALSADEHNHLSFLAGLLKNVADNEPVIDIIDEDSQSNVNLNSAEGTHVSSSQPLPDNEDPDLFMEPPLNLSDLEQIVGGKRPADDRESLGGHHSGYVEPLQTDASESHLKKKSKRKTGKTRGEEVFSWEELPLSELHDKFSVACHQISSRLKQACEDEFALHNLADVYKGQILQLKAEKQSLADKLKKIIADQEALKDSYSAIQDDVKASKDKQQKLEDAVKTALAQQKEDHKRVVELEEALAVSAQEKQLAVENAIKQFKSSDTFAQEYQLVVSPVTRFFYTKGVDESLSVGGDLSQLPSKKLYQQGVGNEVDSRFQDLVAGVDMLKKYSSKPSPSA